ncbi:MAG: glycosyltransferase family 39 protein [Elusimicrobia bacterium]|nr:glycosyltransferase family 39 protein [Elusimicrobiota bacterium]
MPSSRSSGSIEVLCGRAWPWLALGVCLRLGFVLFLGGRFYQADELGYDGIARSIAQSGLLAPAGAERIFMPVAPFFFSLFYSLGWGVLGARLGGALLSAWTAWMIGRAAADLTGSERAGRFALAAACVYPFFIYYSGLLLTETAYLALSVAGFWLLCKSLGEAGRSLGLAAGAGLALGLAGLTRTEGAAAAGAAFCGTAVLCVLKRYSWRSLLLAGLVWAAPLAAWTVHNKSLCGAYRLDLHGGITTLIGTKYFEFDQIDTALAVRALEADPSFEEASKLGPVERDAFYFAQARRFMVEHPGRTVRQWGRKFLNFWRLYPRQDKAYPTTDVTRPGMGAAPALLALVSLLFEPALMGLGLWGAWLMRRDMARLFPLVLLAAATCAIHVLVVSQMRYRLPVMPWFMLFSAAAADRWLSSREARS